MVRLAASGASIVDEVPVGRLASDGKGLLPVDGMALHTRFWIEKYGWKPEDLGRVAVTQREHARRNPAALMQKPMTMEDYEEAASFYNLCRTKGIQGSNTDFLICAVAARNDFTIFTTDEDFVHFAKILPIVLHSGV